LQTSGRSADELAGIVVDTLIQCETITASSS
jgi:hypothetical protein